MNRCRRIGYVSVSWRQLQDLMILDIVRQLVPDAYIHVLCVGPRRQFRSEYYLGYDLEFSNKPDVCENLTQLMWSIREPFVLCQGDLVFSGPEPLLQAFEALEDGCCLWSPCSVSYNWIYANIFKWLWTNSNAAEYDEDANTVRINMFYFSLLAINQAILFEYLGSDAAFMRTSKQHFENKLSKLVDAECVVSAQPDYFGWLSTAAIALGLDVRVGDLNNEYSVWNAGAGSSGAALLSPYKDMGVATGAAFNYILDYCCLEKFKALSHGTSLRQIESICDFLIEMKATEKINKLIKMVKGLKNFLDERAEEVLQVLHASKQRICIE